MGTQEKKKGKGSGRNGVDNKMHTTTTTTTTTIALLEERGQKVGEIEKET